MTSHAERRAVSSEPTFSPACRYIKNCQTMDSLKKSVRRRSMLIYCSHNLKMYVNIFFKCVIYAMCVLLTHFHEMCEYFM